jgi:sterol 3beta-glucosyltransferase
LHVTVLAAGSRGDIQPYLALAIGLQRAGHQVRFAANTNFATMVGRYGLSFIPLDFDSYAFVQDPRAQSWLSSGSPVKLAVTSLRVVRPMLQRLLQGCWQACQDTEAIIYHSFTLPNAYLIGRQLDLPCLPASMYPVPTRAHPTLPLNLPNRFGPHFNWLSHRVVDQFTWLSYRSAARRAWPDLPPVEWQPPYYQPPLSGQPIVCCYSPAVLPLPADLPKQVHVTGYWPLEPEPDWQPDPALVCFLESGPPPVYVGFGSMGNPPRPARPRRWYWRPWPRSASAAFWPVAGAASAGGMGRYRTPFSCWTARLTVGYSGRWWRLSTTAG